MRNIFDHRILYGLMDDGGQSCQKMSEADGQRCKVVVVVVVLVLVYFQQQHNEIHYYKHNTIHHNLQNTI